MNSGTAPVEGQLIDLIVDVRLVGAVKFLEVLVTPNARRVRSQSFRAVPQDVLVPRFMSLGSPLGAPAVTHATIVSISF